MILKLSAQLVEIMICSMDMIWSVTNSWKIDLILSNIQNCASLTELNLQILQFDKCLKSITFTRIFNQKVKQQINKWPSIFLRVREAFLNSVLKQYSGAHANIKTGFAGCNNVMMEDKVLSHSAFLKLI